MGRGEGILWAGEEKKGERGVRGEEGIEEEWKGRKNRGGGKEKKRAWP